VGGLGGFGSHRGAWIATGVEHEVGVVLEVADPTPTPVRADQIQGAADSRYADYRLSGFLTPLGATEAQSGRILRIFTRVDFATTKRRWRPARKRGCGRTGPSMSHCFTSGDDAASAVARVREAGGPRRRRSEAVTRFSAPTVR